MHEKLKAPFFFFDARYQCMFKRLLGKKSPPQQCDVWEDCQMKEKCFNCSSFLVSSSSPLPSQVCVDAVPQVGHALHLCLLLWPEWLLPQTEEEEKGTSGGRGG